MRERPTMPSIFMAVADLMAERSTCSSRASVGAVLATPLRRIVATGYNGSPSGFPHCDEVGCLLDLDGHCVISIHAEENAILQCAMNGVPTAGLELYCTHSPCLRCTVKLVQAGIVRVYFRTQYGDDAYLKRVRSIMDSAGMRMLKVR